MRAMAYAWTMDQAESGERYYGRHMDMAVQYDMTATHPHNFNPLMTSTTFGTRCRGVWLEYGEREVRVGHTAREEPGGHRI